MPPFAESDLLPISALQHLIYCPRQCALILNEQQWAENRLTVEGQQLHDKAHDTQRSESRPGVRIARGLRLRSFHFGITGQADVVEFTETEDGRPPHVIPIEYKRGRPKKHDADRVQLCAQALCLDEMLCLPEPIPAGRLFYGKTRRRQDVPFDHALRDRTRQAITDLHELVASGQTPPACYQSDKCDRCSLLHICMPRQLQRRQSAEARFLTTLNASITSDEATPA